MADKLTEVKKTLYKEKPTATRVNDMGTEKDGVQCILYHAKSTMGTHWFVIPEKEIGSLREQEKAQLLIRWLDVNN